MLRGLPHNQERRYFRGAARRLVTGVGIFLLTLGPLVVCADSVPEPSTGADETLVRAAFREYLYRMPSAEEVQVWQAAVEAGESAEALTDVLRDSAEHRNVLLHRAEETRDLLTSAVPLALIYVLTYLLLVRGRPERRLLFAVFVFLFTPMAMDFGYVYQNVHHGDFPSFFYGADYIFSRGLSPYGTVLSDQVERHIFPFFHPPSSVIIFYPWTWMSYEQAIIAANLGNQIALCVLLYLLVVRKRKDITVLSVCLLLYILNFYPVRMTLDYGQINLWTTVFICVFIMAVVERRSSALMGLSLACAVIFKIYPICLLAYLVLKRQWMAIAWCMVGIVGCILIGFVVVPWQIWEAWWGAVGSRGLYGGGGPVGLFSPAGPWNQGLNGLMMRIFTDSQFNVALVLHPPLGKVLTYVLALLTVGVGGGLLWSRNRQGLKDAEEMELGLVLVMMSLIVPLSWIHHSVMLLPAITATARRLCLKPRRSAWVLFVLSSCVLAWDWSCLPSEDLRLLRSGFSMLLGSLRAFGLIGLFVSMIMVLNPRRLDAVEGDAL